MRNKKSIVCITGAGMSTESGIPDYRGNKGSYFEGHKPIIHHEFMSSELTRKRYWARSLLGYSPFSNARPNLGHFALADLEKGGWIGVKLEESTELKFQSNSHVLANGTSSWESHLILSGGERKKLSIITQNVDILHSKGGLKNVLHLHGRGDVVRCMSCGVTHDRQYYHDKLWEWNRELIDKSTSTINEKVNRNKENGKTVLRPDGDAEWTGESYDNLMLPPCPHCGVNDTHSDSHNHTNNHKGVNATVNDKTNNSQQAFFKTDVVFFGDSIPRYRVHLSNAAIDAADGLLCIGTSLAVHSAFRLAKRAIGREIPVAILNVGETRVEREGLGISGGGEREIPLVTKIESPIGETLAELVNMLHNEER